MNFRRESDDRLNSCNFQRRPCVIIIALMKTNLVIIQFASESCGVTEIDGAVILGKKF